MISPGLIRLSASDIDAFVACEHLSWLEREVAGARLKPPAGAADPMREILVRRGREHEAAWLARREGEGLAVTRIDYDPARPQSALAATRAAMAAGVPAIYQAVLQHGQWFGIADFLLRVERPSRLGAWSYEAADAKLARRAKPYHVLQLSLYSQLVEAIQGVAPENMHVVVASGKPEAFACREFAAYFRALQVRVAALFSEDARAMPYPLPIEHCEICRWTVECAARWLADDHLTGVANIRRVQVARLEAAGVTTMAALGALDAGQEVPRVPPRTLAGLRQQARLQVAQRRDGKPRYELLSPEPAKGFALLPPPSPGDVFFDMEGDPYLDGGREYLFGAEIPSGTYRAWWGHTHDEEKAAFEQFIDFVVARRAEDPAMHVHHYAPYEPSALKKLAGRHGTREEALDDLLRGQVFVDLYRVVRQALRASFPGYSIKDLEPFYMKKRKAAVKDAGSSIVAYETWLDTQEPSILESLERYNAEDCTSTRLLRDWLLERAKESARQFGDLFAAVHEPPPAPTQSAARDKKLQLEAEKNALVEALTATGDDGSRLLAHLLDYHRREERPAWWAFFDRQQMLPEELHYDTESIAGLEPRPGHEPERDGKHLVYEMTFPAQEFKLKPGDEVLDPATGKSAGELVALELDGSLRLKRAATLAGEALPKALVPGGPYNTIVQRAALRRLASDVVARGIDAGGPYRALRDLLRNAPPRVRGMKAGAALQGTHVDVDTAWPIVDGLDDSSLVVQGPPGSGKTYLGARLIVRLLAEGRKVGVTALSHRAIHNLLEEVERVAEEQQVDFVGLKKGSDEDAFVSKHIRNVTDNPKGMPAGVSLLAGTAWLFSRPDFDQALDYLFIDEAGQVALADALAVGTSARNLVLLGDPNQLPQVSQGTHPDGAAASVLEHVLGEHDTIPRDRGLFLEQSWRMHPDVCSFISELAYEGRLVSAPDRERQRVDSPGLSGVGLRFLPVEHSGNSQRSAEEAAAIRAEYDRLLAGEWTNWKGERCPIGMNDILVVTPYNAQVQTLVAALPKGAQVGTVDKFQGREAAVVFFSMASSSGDDLPRGLEFLFQRNRLNVAISRARALSILVASPRLLQVRCQSIEQMRMANGVARYVELSTGPR